MTPDTDDDDFPGTPVAGTAAAAALHPSSPRSRPMPPPIWPG
jgi:hypothetical protein